VPEGITTAHLTRIGKVRLQRSAIAFCVLSREGTCRYPEELIRSLDELEAQQHTNFDRYTALLSSLPTLCGSLGVQPCNPWNSTSPQTVFMAERDPGFCGIAARCVRARLASAEVKPHPEVRDRLNASAYECLHDGSLVAHGGRLAVTVPCTWHRHALLDRSRHACAALDLLNAINQGRMGKGDLELVIARHGEDIAWARTLARVVTVYDKSEDTFDSWPDWTIVRLPNVGLEQHSFLWHILHNYDRLAERTVFAQAPQPSCGFFLGSGTKGGHLMANTSLLDYLDGSGGDVFMPLTMRMHSDLTRTSLRSSFADLPENTDCSVSRPVPMLPSGQPCDRWLPWEVNNVSEFVRQQTSGKSMMSYRDFFHAVFGREPPAILHFAQGGHFAASRTTLRRISRSTYAWLVSQLEAGRIELVYYMEFSWYYLLHGWIE
jgi:hypothetical protein